MRRQRDVRWAPQTLGPYPLSIAAAEARHSPPELSERKGGLPCFELVGKLHASDQTESWGFGSLSLVWGHGGPRGRRGWRGGNSFRVTQEKQRAD